MKKIAPAFAAVALTCAGLVVANGQPQRFFSESFNQAPASCVKAENALGKIVVAQEKFIRMESGTRHFYREVEVDWTMNEIKRFLRESCADISALDKSGKASAEEMESRLDTAAARRKSEVIEVRMQNLRLNPAKSPAAKIEPL